MSREVGEMNKRQGRSQAAERSCEFIYISETKIYVFIVTNCILSVFV